MLRLPALVVCLTWLPDASAGRGSSCPLRKCGAAGDSKATVDDTTFDVVFKPGHFTCLSCDDSSCAGCGIMCDLSQCQGGFHEQECWCEGGPPALAPAPAVAPRGLEGWQQRRCDASCSMGACEGEDQTCKRRDEACEPWWWCGSAPPGDRISMDQVASDAASFLQRPRRQRVGGRRALRGSRHPHAERSRPAAVTFLRHRLKRRSGARVGAGVLGADMASLRLKTGRYVCKSGAMPPKVKDPQTHLQTSRGYIIFDRSSCEGSSFETRCFCWDEFERLSGHDAQASAFVCDSTCSAGPCDGRTCSSHPPPAPQLGAPAPAVVEPMPPVRQSEDLMVPT